MHVARFRKAQYATQQCPGYLGVRLIIELRAAVAIFFLYAS